MKIFVYSILLGTIFSIGKLSAESNTVVVLADMTCWCLCPVGEWITRPDGTQYLACNGGSESCWIKLPCSEQ